MKSEIKIEAAGGLVRNERGEVLVMLRGGVWDLPKGKIEAGETAEQSALREVSEEIGIPVDALQLGEFIATTEHEYDNYGRHEHKITHWFAMRIACEVPLTPQTDEGITELRWVHSIDGLEPMWENIKSIMSYEINNL